MINVYGIYDGDVCLYVGVTEREPKDRWGEHQRALAKGKHENKTLQKLYNNIKVNNGDFTYRLIDSINAESSLLKFFYEALYVSLLRPKANKIVMQQGKSRIILQRCESDKANKIIKCINGLYDGGKQIVG